MKEILVFTLLQMHGFSGSELDVMMCIGYHESKYRSDLKYTNKDSVDIGIFQINDKYWGLKAKDGCGFSNTELEDASNNVKCARHVFELSGYRAWIAYRKHKKECDKYVFPRVLLQFRATPIPYPQMKYRF